MTFVVNLQLHQSGESIFLLNLNHEQLKNIREENKPVTPGPDN